MLPKINRLKKKKDLERVFKEGKGIREGFLFLKIVKNNLNVSRFGFSVSQKFFKKATLRNKVKRKLREILRLKLPKIKTGFDGVVVVFGPPKTNDFQDAKEVMAKLFKKAKLIND